MIPSLLEERVVVGTEIALVAFEPFDPEMDLLDVKVDVRLGGGPEVAVGALDVLAQVDALGVSPQPDGGRGDVRALLAFVGHLSRV